MQFVYLCRSGENEELRYSIRSVEKFFPEAEIVVVGDPPEWYRGERIYVQQNKNKYANARNNLLTICESSIIKDSFVVMNDDFYIIDSVNKIEYFYSGLLQEKIKSYYETSPKNFYISKLVGLQKKLKSLGVRKPLDYELHVPFAVEKDKLRIAIDHDNLWRSVYGNLFQVGGVQSRDVKVYSSKDKNPRSFPYLEISTPYLSSEDKSFAELKDSILDKILLAPSSLEKKNDANS
jgi:hypothetical protein